MGEVAVFWSFGSVTGARALTSNSAYAPTKQFPLQLDILMSNGYILGTYLLSVPGSGNGAEKHPSGCPGSTFANSIIISRCNFLAYD